MLLVAAIVLLVLMGIFGMVYARAAKERLCRRGSEQLAGVWDGQRKEAIRKAFAGTQVAYWKDTWERVDKRFSDFSDNWVTAYQDACQATHVRGEQSGELLDLRMLCLKRKRSELNARHLSIIMCLA
jgi:hypothetical protein